MGRDIVDDLLVGYPALFYFIVSVFCLHLAALVYWIYTMFTEEKPNNDKRPTTRKRYDDKGH